MLALGDYSVCFTAVSLSKDGSKLQPDAAFLRELCGELALATPGPFEVEDNLGNPKVITPGKPSLFATASPSFKFKSSDLAEAYEEFSKVRRQCWCTITCTLREFVANPLPLCPCRWFSLRAHVTQPTGHCCRLPTRSTTRSRFSCGTCSGAVNWRNPSSQRQRLQWLLLRRRRRRRRHQQTCRLQTTPTTTRAYLRRRLGLSWARRVMAQWWWCLCIRRGGGGGWLLGCGGGCVWQGRRCNTFEYRTHYRKPLKALRLAT